MEDNGTFQFAKKATQFPVAFLRVKTLTSETRFAFAFYFSSCS